MKYAKFINENYVEYPPQNKPKRIFSDGTTRYVSNYNVAEDMLLEDGYLPVIETTMPNPERPEDSFIMKYRLHSDHIEAYWKNQYVAPSLDEIKAKKVEEINQYRKNDYENSSVTFEGNEFPVDDTFCIEVNGALISQESSHEFKVKEKNKYVELDLIQIAQLQKLINEERRFIYNYSQGVKSQIREAKTFEEIKNITYNREND